MFPLNTQEIQGNMDISQEMQINIAMNVINTAAKRLKFIQKLNIQVYVFYEHFLGCKNIVQTC